jgi:hypothetical protein
VKRQLALAELTPKEVLWFSPICLDRLLAEARGRVSFGLAKAFVGA